MNVFFLSGIARSGSTLLGSILNQNPDIYVSPTSPLLDLFCYTEQSLQLSHQQYTFDLDAVSQNVHQGLFKSFYAHIDKPYIIDKHRGWPKNINAIKKIITDNPKIIATHRPIAESIVSFLKLIKNDPDNVIDKELTQHNLPHDTPSRAMWLWDNYFLDPFESIKYGLDHYSQHIHIVRYDDLTSNLAQELTKIYNFLELPQYQHTFADITNTCAEQKDQKWGFKGLHDIRQDICKTSDDPLQVLGKQLCEFFAEYDRKLKTIR